jgi:hypothetical protein
VKAVLGEAFEKAMAGEAVAEWAAANYYDVGGQHGAEASAIFSTLESNFAWTLFDLGATEDRSVDARHRQTLSLHSGRPSPPAFLRRRAPWPTGRPTTRPPSGRWISGPRWP